MTGKSILGFHDKCQQKTDQDWVQEDAVVCNLGNDIENIKAKNELIDLFKNDNGEDRWFLKRD